MSNLFSTIKRHPVVAFYILAFAITWLGWVPQALYGRGLSSYNSPLLNIIGGSGPTLAAVIVILLIKEKGGLRQLFGALFKLRVSLVWYVFVFSFWFVVDAIALGIGAVFGQKIPPLDQFAWLSLFPIFFFVLLQNVWEEIGWRGFALPRLQRSFSNLKIYLIMGLLWILWHLPLMLNPTSPMSHIPWYGTVISILSATVIYTWLYERTNGSLFFVIVYHAMSNTVAYVLLQLGIFESSHLIIDGITAVFAIAIILFSIRDGSLKFSGPQKLDT
jgi:membrane protease YdiL (CAAX protease family)